MTETKEPLWTPPRTIIKETREQASMCIHDRFGTGFIACPVALQTSHDKEDLQPGIIYFLAENKSMIGYYLMRDKTLTIFPPWTFDLRSDQPCRKL